MSDKIDFKQAADCPGEGPAQADVLMPQEAVFIRKAGAADIDAITEMEQLCFTDPWNRDMVAAEFSGLNPVKYYGAEAGGRLVGYAGIWTIAPEGYITNVAVHPDFRRRGIASMLLDELIADCTEKGCTDITLEVRVSNSPAIALYESFGFESAGIRKRYYSDGEDAYVMWRRDSQA